MTPNREADNTINSTIIYICILSMLFSTLQIERNEEKENEVKTRSE